MFKKNVILSKMLMVSLLLFGVVTHATAAGQQNPALSEDLAAQEWNTYTDPRFNFSMEYPANWHLFPRDDSDMNAKGGVVTFSSRSPFSEFVNEENKFEDPHAARVPQVVIGQYLAEFKSDQSLSEWTDAYETVAHGVEPHQAYRQYEKLNRRLEEDGSLALTIEGESELLEFQVTNVPNGEIVWFIWTNIGTSANYENKVIYDYMVNSFKLTENSPTSLYDIYGENFTPQALDLPIADLPPASPEGVVNLPSPSTWIAPIATGNSYDMACGSSYHKDTAINKHSAYAVDILMYLGSVKAAQTSYVFFAGWESGTWGNLVMANYGNEAYNRYTSHYAHLNSFSVSHGQTVNKGNTIGVSGNTGIGTYHLHFHVSYYSNSVNLTGMSGFSPNSNYPSVLAECGTVQR